MTVNEHHPRRVHADPTHTINVVEGDGDQITVKGVDARHPTNVMLCDTFSEDQVASASKVLA